MPKPRQGTEVKKHKSIRIEPLVQAEIERRFGKVQFFIDAMIAKENLRPDTIDPLKK